MKYLQIIAVMALATTLVNCSEKPKEPVKQEKYCLDESFKKEIKFITAKKEKVSENLHLTGIVETNPDKVVSFKSLFSGIVTNTFFSLGDRVSKGQVLAEISSTELSSLNAELQSLDAQIRVSEAKLKSVSDMYRDGISSQREINEAQSELDVLKAEKAKVVSNRSLYSASNTKNVFQIKAPASGIITSKNITPGAQITGEDEDPLFTISNLENVWVMANIYATNLQNVKEGMEVEIRTMSYPDEVFKGKISVISQMLDESAKVLKARIVLDNSNKKLKPGMLAEIILLNKRDVEAVSVPVSDVIFADNESYVVVYKSDCDIQIRNVKVVAKNNESVFIGDGLAENEQIVSEKQLLIFNRLHQ